MTKTHKKVTPHTKADLYSLNVMLCIWWYNYEFPLKNVIIAEIYCQVHRIKWFYIVLVCTLLTLRKRLFKSMVGRLFHLLRILLIAVHHVFIFTKKNCNNLRRISFNKEAELDLAISWTPNHQISSDVESINYWNVCNEL